MNVVQLDKEILDKIEKGDYYTKVEAYETTTLSGIASSIECQLNNANILFVIGINITIDSYKQENSNMVNRYVNHNALVTYLCKR